MRWSIIRLIWLRELRDQLRDRRTVFMIAVLPIFLYPVAGLGVIKLAQGYLMQTNKVGLVGADNLLPWTGAHRTTTTGGAAAWFACTPPPPGVPLAGVERVAAALALTLAQPDPAAAASSAGWLAWTPGGLDRLGTALAFDLAQPRLDYPPLVERRAGQFAFVSRYTDTNALTGALSLRALDGPVADGADLEQLAAPYRAALDDRKVDLLLIVPPGVQDELQAGGQPTLYVLTRPKDDTSRLVNIRLTNVLVRWRRDLKEVRMARAGLPPDFDHVFHIQDPQRAKPAARLEAENLFNLMVRVFPFVLVLWSLAGALYPAVDLCAGEKERGTMETLLISPASREEIVWGKFLTIWLFSAATALLNLLSMALTTAQLGAARGATFRPGALIWGVLLLLPLSAFFSALCLAVGAYARSSKEGQYYLMPLFMVTMPLIFLTLAPGVELNPFYSMVPVTGVALLLQRLVAEGPDRGVWLYFVPVLAPMIIYSWLALRWAIEQFQREEVLFREAERLDLGLWLKRLLREKEALPSAGEAIFCFVLILALRWVSFGLGQQLPLLTRTGVGYLAFVLTPPLFMAVVLTTKPWRGLSMLAPPWWAWPAAAVLALLVVPPLAELTLLILRQFPALKTLLEMNHPLTGELQALMGGSPSASPLLYFVVLALLPAVCEEVAFRGFILGGLLRGFRAWTAILLSAFLFALYQMNVFQFVPHFVFGVILGLLVVRTRSVLPAMLFHLVYNTLVIAPTLLPGAFSFLQGLGPAAEGMADLTAWRLLLSGGCSLLAAGGLAAIWWAAPRREAAP